MHGTTYNPKVPKTLLGGREESGTSGAGKSWEDEDPWKSLREREMGTHWEI